MNKLNSIELERMIATVEESFNDVAYRWLAGGSGQDSFGELHQNLPDMPLPLFFVLPQWEEISCGFSYQPEYRNERGQIVTLDCDAILRVSLLQDVSVENIVYCQGKYFTVDGVVEGRLVKIVALKRIQAGDDVLS